MARSLKARLIHELASVRKEMLEPARTIPEDGLEFAPAPSMKSYRKILEEIGGMEYESYALLESGVVPDWSECEAQVTGQSASEVVESLDRIRQKTLACIEGLSDEQLEEPVPIPDFFASFFGDSELERQELIRWIIRHESYHAGQLVSYRWIQGLNPYEKSSKASENG